MIRLLGRLRQLDLGLQLQLVGYTGFVVCDMIVAMQGGYLGIVAVLVAMLLLHPLFDSWAASALIYLAELDAPPSSACRVTLDSDTGRQYCATHGSFWDGQPMDGTCPFV